MKQYFIKIMSLVLALSLCLAVVSCGPSNETNDPKDNGEATSYVELQINPSIELTVSDGGTVLSVYGANDDAKVLLYEQEAEIVGKKLEEAVEYITAAAVDLGYLSEDNTDVTATVIAGKDSVAAELREIIDSKVVSTAQGKGLAVTVSSEVAFELLCELERLKEEYKDNDTIQNLTPEKYKLAASVAEGGEITIEAAVEMSDEKLIEELKKTHSEMKAFATDAYLEAKARATALFESSMGVLEDSIYTAVYANRIPLILSNLSYMNTLHYGATYQAYKTTARTYNAVLEIMKFGNEYASAQLPESVTSEIIAALEITDSSVLEDENGKITVMSVTSYCNEFVRENELSDSLKATLTEALAEAKDAAELVAISSEAYAADLNSLKLAIEGVVTTVNAMSSSMMAMLPEEAKAQFQTCLDDLAASAEKLAEIMENGDTSDAVKELADEAEKKAAAMLERINEDLSEKEKSDAEAMRTQIEDSIKSLTEEFEARLATAESEAKKILSEKRKERQDK